MPPVTTHSSGKKWRSVIMAVASAYPGMDTIRKAVLSPGYGEDARGLGFDRMTGCLRRLSCSGPSCKSCSSCPTSAVRFLSFGRVSAQPAQLLADPEPFHRDRHLHATTGEVQGCWPSHGRGTLSRPAQTATGAGTRRRIRPPASGPVRSAGSTTSRPRALTEPRTSLSPGEPIVIGAGSWHPCCSPNEKANGGFRKHGSDAAPRG